MKVLCFDTGFFPVGSCGLADFLSVLFGDLSKMLSLFGGGVVELEGAFLGDVAKFGSLGGGRGAEFFSGLEGVGFAGFEALAAGSLEVAPGAIGSLLMRVRSGFVR